MKLVVNGNALKRILRWTRYLFFASAAAMLAYCGFVAMDTWAYRNRADRQFAQSLLDRRETNGGARSAASPASPASAENPQPAAAGGLIGRIEIARLGVSAMVIEGTSRTTLRRAVGHISGTALPGQAGNVGISGHRDTFFRPLRNIRRDDIITLTTLAGEFHYRVITTQVVGPFDVAVLDPSGNEVLTLVTCYPFYFVGPAPGRFIVRADRVA
jgi:sortase A